MVCRTQDADLWESSQPFLRVIFYLSHLSDYLLLSTKAIYFLTFFTSFMLIHTSGVLLLTFILRKSLPILLGPSQMLLIDP